VKRCPKCGASAADDDLFCENDGARLEGAGDAGLPHTPTPSPVVAVATTPTGRLDLGGAACPGCGAVASDDGDGYCASCGLRLSDGTSAAVPEGASLAGGVVTGAVAADTLIVRAPTGESYLVAVGTGGALAGEARALEALAKAGERRVPTVRARGEDPRRGAFLALDPPAGAEPLLRKASELAPPRALDVVAATLDRIDAIESCGVTLRPSAEDLALDAAGAPALLRLREGAPRTQSPLPALPSTLQALGGALLAGPLAHASPTLVRLLSPVPARAGTTPSAAVVRSALAVARAELAPPIDAHPGLATLTDRGCKKPHNEDAVAMARGELAGEPWTVMVVCDGVSCSHDAEMASTIAAQTTCDALAHFAGHGDLSFEATTAAVGEAIRAAHVAICAQRRSERAADAPPDDSPPGTTIVAALIHKRRLTVGWVGDSRAYWITTRGGELLTRDHSWVNDTVDHGDMTLAEALASPYAHALTKCLGPLEVGDALEQVSPDVRTRDLAGPGDVLLCSDGLWNYFPEPESLRAIIAGAGEGASAGLVARRLVNHALARGGHDNVSVALFMHR
jgi:serine/threonine protein phosphatase PrpC